MTELIATNRDERRRERGWRRAYDYVRVGLGLLLLTAAALKGHEVMSGPVLGKGLLGWRPVVIAAVEFEIVLGLCLISGVWRRQVWGVSVVCFVLFSWITAYKAILGEGTCGCFGRVDVDPRYTLMLDIGCLAALVVFRPGEDVGGVTRRKKLVVGVVAMVVGIPGGIAMARYRPAVLGDGGQISQGGSFVILEPESWIGKRFPLLKHIDIGEEIGRGRCVVLLYHHSCPDCRRAIGRLSEGVGVGVGVGEGVRVYFVEVPPYGVVPGQEKTVGERYAFGRLSDEVEWFVPTPVVLELRDGVVVRRLEEVACVAGCGVLAMLD